MFFLAFGFLASWLFGFSAFGLFGFLVVYATFGGFLALAFRILCIPSSSSAGGVLAFAAGGFGFSHPLPLLCFFFTGTEMLYLNHHFLTPSIRQQLFFLRFCYPRFVGDARDVGQRMLKTMLGMLTG